MSSWKRGYGGRWTTSQTTSRADLALAAVRTYSSRGNLANLARQWFANRRAVAVGQERHGDAAVWKPEQQCGCATLSARVKPGGTPARIARGLQRSTAIL